MTHIHKCNIFRFLDLENLWYWYTFNKHMSFVDGFQN